MEARKLWGFVIVGILVVLGAIWFFLGPTGQATVEAIDQTAQQVTGKQAVDQGAVMRQEVKAISTEHTDRLRGVGLERGAPAR